MLALEDENERLLIELTEIPAPPFMEEKRAARYAELLREGPGLEAELDAVGNVIARRGGRDGGRTVAVVAHLDTVFPEGTDVTVKREGDKLMAPGIADDTRGPRHAAHDRPAHGPPRPRTPRTMCCSSVPSAKRGSGTFGG